MGASEFMRRSRDKMPTPSEFRERFKEWIGAERFREFVKALHQTCGRTSRLRFWQVEIWRSFVSENPRFELSNDDLVDRLRICELHEDELVRKEIPATNDCIDYTRDYECAWVTEFPHATMEMITVSPEYTKRTHPIWVCSTCDEVRNASKLRRR